VFNCGVCSEAVAPKVKANRIVVMTRGAQYHNVYFREDEWGNRTRHEVDSQGTEIVKELLACDRCAGEPIRNTPSVERVGRQRFEEKSAPGIEVKLIAAVVQNMLDRMEHKSKRAQRDTAATIPGIKEYVDAHKDFVF
jgi:hypothetical protein